MNKDFNDFKSKYSYELHLSNVEDEPYSKLTSTLFGLVLRVLELYHQWLNED